MTLNPRTPSPRLHHDILSMVCDNGLEQLVKEPTREENTLDLFLTNFPLLVPRVEVVPGISDHSIPYCEISTSARRKKQTQRQIPLYNKADWDSLRTAATELSADLKRMDGVAATEELWTTFKNSLLAAVKKFINKRFWSYIKHQKSSNTGVAPLKKDGQLTSDPKAQAELLNEQF